MTIQQIVKTWGVSIPDYSGSVYLPDYLMQNYPSKCYYAGYYPKIVPVEYTHKYLDIESDVLKLVCERMYHAIFKLWVYDDLYFESELLNSANLSKKRFKRRKLSKKIETNLIDDAEILKELLDLSNNEVIDIVLAFEKHHILMIPSWTSFFLFVENDSCLTFIRDILNTEGLHFTEADV